jgi:hypothetical protein
MKFLSCSNSVLLAALYCMSLSVTTTTAFSQPMNTGIHNMALQQSQCTALHSHTSGSDSDTDTDTASSIQTQSRARFLSTFAAAVVSVSASLVVSTEAANAAEKIDPAVKGTKKDPGYEACVSQCMYECTKPKGMEQKSRSECLPGCKKECATTKAQLMVGTPAK